jgi:hypothetical protein
MVTWIRFPYWRPTNIRCRRSQCRRHGDLAIGNFTPLYKRLCTEGRGKTSFIFLFRCLVFRRVRLSCEERLSVSSCLSACVRAALTGREFVKFDIGNGHKNLFWNSRFGYNRPKNIGHFIWSPKNVLLLLVTYNPHKSAIFGNEMMSGCWDSRGSINVTRTRHNVYCLPC